ncbi:D-alanine--D-alanine ligase [Aliidiomarina minuta]|uniref:D-alanine--D-alanine ligase n=1 Tax=Aliidiomarina minuta TaxID=880057 RepID=A0A432WAJ2_9GAMM|nr:D-alanine--D-alanine ligase [Aliidiomarina minuta]RUO26618.1 D-alanine--D-alanine ligase [Aliidiomarina minuta]
MTELGKVAVLAGGFSAEREVSLRSGDAVLKGLLEEGVDAHFYDTAEQSLLQLPELGFRRAFIALHGRGGEDGHTQAVLSALQVPYTGSGVMACALAMDKARTKYLWTGMGLPTAASQVVNREQSKTLDYAALLKKLGGKVMVKPSQEGSSVGMAQASDVTVLAQAVTDAARYDDDVLIEQWLPGEEYTVAILGEEALPTIRVRTPHEFYDYAAKYEDNTTEYLCPAGLSEEAEQEVRELALKAFAAVGGSGWGRVDLKQDAQGAMQLLEVNTVPGMTVKSLVPMAAKQQGMSFAQLVVRILADTRE